MIEVEFKDRVPTHAGRVKMIPVDGLPDTFTMTRADEPLEEGTPLDKETFESIIQSRLTGRYYELTATKNTLTNAGGFNNPIPSSWLDTTGTGAHSGGYSIEASGTYSTSFPHQAFDGQTNSYWISNTSAEPWIQLNVPGGIIVNKIKLAFKQADSWSTETVLQAKMNGGSWVNLITISGANKSTLTEYTINNPAMYTAYRLKFSIARESEITLYEWQISDWSSATYRYEYKIDNGVPLNWTKWQRITVIVPNYVITAVTQNRLNGIPINTILQPNRRYELIYNGASFDAKEL